MLLLFKFYNNVKARKWRKWIQNSKNRRAKGKNKMKEMLFRIVQFGFG